MSASRMTALLLLASAGCHTFQPPADDRSTVTAYLESRGVSGGVGVGVGQVPGEISLPPGVTLDAGLTPDAAVAVALRNNALFQQTLADLRIAAGDLTTAGLLPNPEFFYTFSAPDKPFRYLFDMPIEAIWLRPIRVASAGHDSASAGQRLTQAGLDLMRDVRNAHAASLLARDRLRVAQESAKIRGRVAELAAKRLEVGDISPLESATAKIDALQAEQDVARVAYDVPVADEALKNLLGVGRLRAPLGLESLPPPALVKFDVDALTDEAVSTRADALAADEAIAAAEVRVKFARVGWVRLLGILDGTSGRKTGHELAPGFRVTVPIFNQNQGNLERAEAEFERAVRARQTVAYQIILDVQRAHLQYQQAYAELDLLLTKVRPEVEAAIRRSQAAYQEGDVNYLIVLQSTQQLIDSRLREAVLRAAARQAFSELERAVGRRLMPPAAP